MTPYWADGQVTLWHANALDLPLPDASVDLVVTSPPYWSLRSYRDGGEHYADQIGDEGTPTEFVDHLIAATREMVRVLKPSGSIWINLGDKYASYEGGRGAGQMQNNGPRPTIPRGAGLTGGGAVRAKSLFGIPWRYALRCIDDLGLILRAEIIWSKPNGLPESVNDRVRRSHEQWFHFTLEPRYYSAVDEVREEHTSAHPNRGGFNTRGTDSYQAAAGIGATGKWDGEVSALGKLPGSVWTIPTQPLRVPAHLGIDHFAAFPMAWPRRIITGWSPRDVCTACGEGRRPVVVRGPQPVEPDRGGNRLPAGVAGNGTLGFRASKLSGQEWNAFRADHPDTITGYACACPPPPAIVRTKSGHWAHYETCPTVAGKETRPAFPDDVVQCHSCPRVPAAAPTTPGVVLDPFMGTGTTLLVASALGRTSHGVDLSADYCRLAQWRVTDPGERARALEVDKPPVEIDGQDDLLDLLGAS